MNGILKEEVSVDECIEWLREYISKQWNTESTQDMAKSALELLIIKIDRLKRLEENVKKKIKYYGTCSNWIFNEKDVIKLLESLDK